MTGSDLAYLAGAADLARLEFASPRLTLHTEGGRLSAQYAGAYSSGARWIEQDRTVPPLDIDVDSDKFKYLAMTFSADTPVRISQSANSLSLRSKGNNHQLRCYPSSERVAAPEDVAPFATCDAEKLLDEIELATDLNEQNKASHGPIGINITVNKAKGYLRVMSYNGHSALFIAQIDCEEVNEDAALVVPAKDFAKGVQLFGEGLLQLGMSSGRVVLRGSRAWFTAPTEARDWPNFAKMLKKNPKAQHVVFRSDQVKAAAQSAKVLGAANVLEISGGENGVVLKTSASEAGVFQTAIEGRLDGSFFYGADDLLFASKLSKEEIEFEINKGPTTVRQKRRMLVLMTRAV